MNIAELFTSTSRHYPSNVALIEGDKQVTYEQLDKEIRQTARYFQTKGLQPGDRVLVFVPMSIDLYRIVLALFHAGMIAVFVDQWVNLKRLKACCELAECQGFIGSKKAGILKALIPPLKRIPITLSSKTLHEQEASVVPTMPDESALITFTTGSTGLPKAADRTHGFLKAQFDSLIRVIQPSPKDVDYTNLPILPLLNLATGGSTVLENPKGDNSDLSEKMIRLYKKHQFTRITASPALVDALAQTTLTTKTDTTSLSKVFTGGAPVFPSDARLFKKAFPVADITGVYGSTEAEPISSISADDLLNDTVLSKGGLPVGKLADQTQVRILSLDGTLTHQTTEDSLQKQGLPDGNIGEIVVAGPHVLKRYFRNPEAFQANKIVTESETWHRTGDSGFLINGQLYLTGRCKELIRMETTYLSPFVVESVLRNIEGVSAGTILKKETQIILVIEGKANQAELRSLEDLTSYDRLIFLKKIPKDPRHQSKIDYEKLRKLIQS